MGLKTTAMGQNIGDAHGDGHGCLWMLLPYTTYVVEAGGVSEV